jgi:hypothetical protein
VSMPVDQIDSVPVIYPNDDQCPLWLY